MKRLIATIVLCLWTVPAFAQYNQSAGKSKPVEMVADEEGSKIVEKRTYTKDAYGNPGGEKYDLAYDGAFEGQTIVVVMLVPWGKFDDARRALKTKGFGVVEYRDLPSPKELKTSLDKANQFWLISSCGESNGKLTEKHVKVINGFFQKGHGLYVWGDNDPCNNEANYVATRVLDVSMSGDLPGDKVVTFKTKKNRSGLLRDHLISTGIEMLYEGVTVATIKLNDAFTPFLWGSDGGVVAAFYDHKGRRAIVDGGMTRLYNKWDTAGTGRYVVNAASWLANAERFKEIVKPAKTIKKQPTKKTPAKKTKGKQ